MWRLLWAAACLPVLLTATGARAEGADTPDACPQGQMLGADGQCIPNTGKGQSGNPGGGTAAVEAAKGGAAANSNKDNAPADASQLGPGAVGPSSGDKGKDPAAGEGNSQ